MTQHRDVLCSSTCLARTSNRRVLPSATGTQRSIPLCVFPVPPPRGAVDKRAFVLLHWAGDAEWLTNRYLRKHAVDHPDVAQEQHGASADAIRPLPYKVFLLRAVIRGIQALPVEHGLNATARAQPAEGD